MYPSNRVTSWQLLRNRITLMHSREKAAKRDLKKLKQKRRRVSLQAVLVLPVSGNRSGCDRRSCEKAADEDIQARTVTHTVYCRCLQLNTDKTTGLISLYATSFALRATVYSLLAVFWTRPSLSWLSLAPVSRFLAHSRPFIHHIRRLGFSLAIDTMLDNTMAMEIDNGRRTPASRRPHHGPQPHSQHVHA